MPAPAHPSPRSARGVRPVRTDGLEARERLLFSALALFAERGFAKTSTRAIAQAAGVNIAAISYYFGDKAGLYAACFAEPMGGNAGELIALYDDPSLSLEDALSRFLISYVEPLKQGDIVRQCMRLHLREMLEPTGQRAKEIARDILGPHQALIRVLERHLGVPADDEMHRLAFAITGLSLQLYVNLEFIESLRPQLLQNAASVDCWAQSLVQFALALVNVDAQRRLGGGRCAQPSPTKTAHQIASATTDASSPPIGTPHDA